MIRTDIQQHPDVGPKAIDAVELKTAEFQHGVGRIAFGQHPGKAVSYVARLHHIEAGRCQQVMGEVGGGRLAVRSRDADHERLRIAGRELDLGDHGDPAFLQGPHQRRAIGNAGTLNDFRAVKYGRPGMSSFFEGDGSPGQFQPVAIGHGSRIREPDGYSDLCGE